MVRSWSILHSPPLPPPPPPLPLIIMVYYQLFMIFTAVPLPKSSHHFSPPAYISPNTSTSIKLLQCTVVVNLPPFLYPISTKPSSYSPPIPSTDLVTVEALIIELPVVFHISRFAVCLGIQEERTVAQENKNSFWEQTTEIAIRWYHSTPDPHWQEVVEALMCAGYCKDALRLADHRGVVTGALLGKGNDCTTY